MKHSYRADIDGLRAIAVLSVLLFHLDVPFFKGGYLGVDIFFVISGFLITRILRDEVWAGEFTYLNFYERRARRILPSALFILFLSVIGAALFFTPADMVNFGNSLMATLVFISNFYFWDHIGYFTGDAHVKPLLHMWSLSVEEQFYLIWPVLLAFLIPKTKNRILLIVMAVAGVASLAAAAYFNSIHPNATFYLLPFRLFEFLIGAGTVWLMAKPISKPIVNEILTVIGIVLIGISVTALIPVTAYPSLYTLVPCIGAAMVIYAAAQTRSRWLLANPVTVYIGLISYQLYLTHWPIYVFYKYRLLHALSDTDRLIIGVASVALAIPIYHLIDKPLRKVKTRAAMWRFFIAMGVVCVILAGVAVSIRASHGWPWRIEERFRTLITDPQAFHKAQYGGIAFMSDNVQTIGAAGTQPSFIIFGDSFSRQYAAGLDRLLKENNKSAIALWNAICLMTPDVSPVNRGPADEACNAQWDKVAALVAANPNLPIVVAHSWHTYKDISANKARQKYLFTSDTQYYQFMIYEIERIRVLAGENRKMVLIGVAPGMGDQQGIIRCFTMPTYLPNDCAASVSLPVSEMRQGLEFNQLADAYAKQHPNITFLNPRDVVCDDKTCWAFKGTELYYSDYIHFSVDGSWLFVNHFRDVFLGLNPVAPPAPTPAAALAPAATQP